MSEIVPLKLNVFENPPIQISTSEFFYEKVHTKTSLTGQPAVLEWVAAPHKTAYTNLKDSFLWLRVALTLNNDLAIGEHPGVGLVQAPLTSIFRRMQMDLNDVRVSGLENNSHYVNWLHFQSQPQSVKDTKLSLALWKEETHKVAAAPLDLTANNPSPQAVLDGNAGLKYRADALGNSREVDLLGQIQLPLHTSDRLLPPNVKLGWKFELANKEFYMMTGENAPAYKLVIIQAVMMVRREQVSSSLALAQSQLLQTNKNMIFPCSRISTRTQSIPQGSFGFRYENAFVGKNMPLALYVGFLKSVAYEGAYNENPFCFWNVNLTRLIATLGAKRVPHVEYKLDFTQNRSQFALWNTISAMGYLNSGSGPGYFNRDTYDKGLFIYGLNLSRDGDVQAAYNNSNFDASSVSVEGEFSVATGVPYTGNISQCRFLCIRKYSILFPVIIFGLFRETVELNKFLVPLISWT